MIELNRRNRRRHLRILADFPVHLEDAGGIRTLHAVDLSEWGLRLSTLVGSNVPRKGELTLRFCLPGDVHDICVSACVTATRERQLELSTSTRFTMISREDAARLRCFVQACRQAA